jgi:hypothetical protein
MIPKNIIQICIGPEDNNTKYWLHLAKKWEIDYPHWNHHVYRDAEVESIVKEYSSLAWEMYDSCPIYSFKADLARLIILHKVGGLYIDIDSRPNLDLDTYVVHSDEMRWGFYLTINEWANPWEIVTNNHLVAAEANSEMIKSMIDNILNDFIELKSSNDDGDDAGQKAGFKFAKLVSTTAWGRMIHKKLDSFYDGDYLAHHLGKGYGKVGLFWISWDGEQVSIRKDRGFITHVGSILIKDFLDVNLPEEPMQRIANLYEGLIPHNGEIKIYSGGINGV